MTNLGQAVEEPRWRGFMLVELLIVAIIIGILAAIALPRFGRSREKAYSAAMRSDLKSLATLQNIHHRQNGRYAAVVDAVSFAPTAGVRVAITGASAETWTAVASHVGTPHVCVARFRATDLRLDCSDTDRVALIRRPVNPVDSILAALPFAAAGFNSPEKMFLGRTETVAFVLDPRGLETSGIGLDTIPSAVVEEVEASVLVSTGGESGRIETRLVRYAPRMIARLAGESFRISPGPQSDQLLIRAVGSREQTTWTWEVEPTKRGQHLLELSASALIDVNGRETPLRADLFRKSIVVEVRWSTRAWAFLFRHWQWLAGLLLAPPPFLIWIRRWLLKRRRTQVRADDREQPPLDPAEAKESAEVPAGK